MEDAIHGLAQALGTTLEDAERWRERLAPVRALLAELDDLTWREGRVSGRENHLWLVSSSDFNGDPHTFEAELGAFLAEARRRKPKANAIRIGIAGVPPIVDDLHDFIEERGAQVVMNEVQRQFSMPGKHQTLAEQYSAYTYPYSIFLRLEDVRRETRRREIHGVIHYAQTFCHRQIESILFDDLLPVPTLTIEADRPGPLEARTRTRIEAFLERIR